MVKRAKNIYLLVDRSDVKELKARPIDENINIDKKLEEKTKEEQEEVKEEEIKENNNLEKELFNNFDDSKEYSIYRVYTVKEDDTIDLILDKFNVTRDILKDYNSLDNLTVGSKIIIPSIDE